MKLISQSVVEILPFLCFARILLLGRGFLLQLLRFFVLGISEFNLLSSSRRRQLIAAVPVSTKFQENISIGCKDVAVFVFWP